MDWDKIKKCFWGFIIVEYLLILYGKLDNLLIFMYIYIIVKFYVVC